MKYEANTKTARNLLIVEYYEKHGGLSLDEIGRVFGISGTRVWQIKNRFYDLSLKNIQIPASGGDNDQG